MTNNVGTHGPCVQHTERKSPRAEFHNYSGGDYFVTICTRDKEHYFGKIIPNVGTHGSCVHVNEMQYSPIGHYCHDQLMNLPKHYPYVEVPLFVVMPNHVHAIISIKNNDANNRTHEPCDNSTENRTHEPCVPTVRSALSVVVGGVKRAVTMFARRNNIEFGWQSRYHDHIIRGAHDGNRIAEYIENNVARWGTDCFNQ